MLQKKSINRRQFLKRATGAAAAMASITIVPRHVLGGPGYTSPSEKLNIAGIGIGGQGKSDVKKVSGENIVALCDVDWEYSAKVFENYPQARKYKDFRRMLEKEKSIDAVIIATPDHSHAVIAMMAIKMGKHVYCEKPMTHTVYEARALTEAAREAGVATQMGNQGHSREGVRLICEWIWGGAIGPVREVYAWTNRPIWPQGIDRHEGSSPIPSTLDWDLWLGPAPKRPYVGVRDFSESNKRKRGVYHPFNWRGWWDFGCGALGDMACHVLDPVFSALKLRFPISVEASCTKVNKETYPLASIVRYEFPARWDMPPVKLTWYDGALKPARPEELEPGRKIADGSNSGVIFVGEKGKLMCGEYGDHPRLIPETKMQAYERPPKTIPRIEGNHGQDWVRACKGGKPACSNFDYAGPLTETVVMGNLAIRYPGRKLDWDGENMKVTNLPEANEYIRTQYRKGWTL